MYIRPSKKYSRTSLARTRRDVCASSTHPCVRAIPSLTIFKLVHVYSISSRTSRLLSTKVAKRTWHLSLIKNPMHARDKMISGMCKHMNLLKVNTFISMRICTGWSMHLLSSKLNCSSSSGWMFLFMCRYSLCSVVYRFLWNNKRKKKSLVLIIYSQCASFNE